MTVRSERDDRARAAAVRWWRSLGPVTIEGGRTLPGDRATLARLRRCGSAMDALVEPATARLFKALSFDRSVNDHLGRTAALAAVLAHVRTDAKGRIARAIGSSTGEPEDALLKPNRFRALMAARTHDEVLTGFRRVVALLGGTASVADLARLILGWTDDEAGDRVRTHFAFDYYGAGAFAPDNGDSDTAVTPPPASEKV